jgi:transposase
MKNSKTCPYCKSRKIENIGAIDHHAKIDGKWKTSEVSRLFECLDCKKTWDNYDRDVQIK